MRDPVPSVPPRVRSQKRFGLPHRQFCDCPVQSRRASRQFLVLGVRLPFQKPPKDVGNVLVHEVPLLHAPTPYPFLLFRDGSPDRSIHPARPFGARFHPAELLSYRIPDASIAPTVSFTK